MEAEEAQAAVFKQAFAMSVSADQEAYAKAREARLGHRAEVEDQIRAKEEERKKVIANVSFLFPSCGNAAMSPLPPPPLQLELDKLRARKEVLLAQKAEANVRERLKAKVQHTVM